MDEATDHRAPGTGGGSPAPRRGLVVLGVLLVVATALVAFITLSALTLSVMERQRYWCDDCPDLPPAVYATDERYVTAVLLLGIGAMLAALVAAVVALVRRSRRALLVGGVVAGLLLVGGAGATLVHLVRY